MLSQIFVVDDDPTMRDLLEVRLRKLGYSVVLHPSAHSALAALEGGTHADAILSDVRMDGMDGIVFCERVAAMNPEIPVVVMTAHSSMDVVVQALRAQAFDFLSKPLDQEKLALSVASAVRKRHARSELSRIEHSHDAQVDAVKQRALLGASPGMLELNKIVASLAAVDSSVLVTGESGTGKEIVARTIHEGSRRKGGPFVAVNCGAIPEGLIEAELFGALKGAFTGSVKDRIGLFEEANGGTLFLDEIGELPLQLQPKLLRAIQEKFVRRVGATKETAVDVRVLAATHRDLLSRIKEGSFREDLYYRLNVVEVHVPALRDRGTDILVYAHHFLSQFAQAAERKIVGLTPEAADKLLAHDWPGNVRELQNAMERAVAFAAHDRLTVADLPHVIQRLPTGAHPSSEVRATSTMQTLEAVERGHIDRVLRATEGNKTLAAEILGVDRKTLQRRAREKMGGGQDA